MKSKLAHIGLVVLTSCTLISQASNVAAQTNMETPATNVIRRVTQEESLEMATERIRAALAQQTNVVRHFSKEDEEWVSKLRHNHAPPKSWPDPSHKQATLKYCAAVMRSAIDAKEIELACSQLTNQPEAAVALKDLSNVAMSSLDEFAAVLISPEITTTIGSEGYRAVLTNSQNFYIFTFLTKDNDPRTIRSFTKKQHGSGLLIMGGAFYENGKLEVFTVTSLDSKGNPQESGMHFMEDGKLDYHWIKPNETKP